MKETIYIETQNGYEAKLLKVILHGLFFLLLGFYLFSSLTLGGVSYWDNSQNYITIKVIGMFVLYFTSLRLLFKKSKK